MLSASSTLMPPATHRRTRPTQDSIIKLSVSKDPRGGWTAKMGTTIGDRGKCEGHNIPPLECVIETRWPGVKVDWNGHDPIL